MMPGDGYDEAMSESNNLGEESLGKWIYGDGFKALNRIITDYPEYIPSVTIIDEHRKTYEIDEFFAVIEALKLYK